jgi:hypothetical protein
MLSVRQLGNSFFMSQCERIDDLWFGGPSYQSTFRPWMTQGQTPVGSLGSYSDPSTTQCSFWFFIQPFLSLHRMILTQVTSMYGPIKWKKSTYWSNFFLVNLPCPLQPHLASVGHIAAQAICRFRELRPPVKGLDLFIGRWRILRDRIWLE